MDETSRDYTAFNTPWDQYRWKVYPFGLQNGPALCQRWRHKVFPPVHNMKSIRNANELLKFSGVVNYYMTFIPHLPNKLAPLYDLTSKLTKWEWTDKCQDAVNDT